MADTRSQTIDALKGIAILIVMLGHVLSWNHMEDGYLYDAIKVVQMPLFILVSGYLCGIGRPVRTWAEYGRVLKGRALGYLVPFFLWIISIQFNSLLKMPFIEQSCAHVGLLWPKVLYSLLCPKDQR